MKAIEGDVTFNARLQKRERGKGNGCLSAVGQRGYQPQVREIQILTLQDPRGG